MGEALEQLDDQTRLSACMSKPSWKVGWEKRDTVQLRVTIDYDLPKKGTPHLLGLLFGRFYAKGCTRRMVRSAHRFSK